MENGSPSWDSAGIPARVAQRMLRIADIGAKYDSKSYLEAVKALGGIEATLDALAASPKKVRELVARHNRIAELKAALEATRDALVDLEERDALMGISPENRQAHRPARRATGRAPGAAHRRRR